MLMNCGTFSFSLWSLSHLITFNFCSELYVWRKWYYYRPPTKLKEGNVFTGHSVQEGGPPIDYYPWCIGSHCTGSPSRHGTWGHPLAPTVETLPLQTRDLFNACSVQNLPPPRVLTSGSSQNWNSLNTIQNYSCSSSSMILGHCMLRNQ